MKYLHRFIALIVVCTLVLTLAACGNDAVNGSNGPSTDSSGQRPSDSAAPTVPTGTTMPTQPGTTAPTEPATMPTEPSVPTEPTDPTNPTDPTDPTEPTEPTTPIEPPSEELIAKLDKILAKYGSSPRDIYDYVHDHYKYKYTREKSMVENALHLLEYGTGSCYNFASLTYYLFQRAGYEVYYVTGLGWQNNSYHCWILAYFDDGWYYVDSLYVRSAKLTADDLRRIGYSWDEDAYPS